MLSKKAKYAIRSLICLAEEFDKGTILIADIAKKEQIPKKFLEAILLDLRKNGILQSRKGKGGGYYLRKAPSEIKLAQVIRLMDGPIAYTPCVTPNFYEKCSDCPDEAVCGIKLVMHRLREASLQILEGTSIADVLQNEIKLKSELTKV